MPSEIESPIEESLILTLFDLVNFITKNGEIMVLEEGLTVQQWLVLLQIAGDPGFPQPGKSARAATAGVLASEIAASRGVSRSNISALIASLLRKRLVRQVEDPRDRRRKFLKITADGKKVLKQIEPTRRSVNTALFADFSKEELKVVHQLLQRLLENLWQNNARRDSRQVGHDADAAAAGSPDERAERTQ